MNSGGALREEKIKQYQEMINLGLDEYLPPAENFPPVINQAMRYSVMEGGKRLRPLLVLAAAEAVGGDPKKVLPAAVAIELIHNYSLIHDDLPAMDNDDFRRGRPTSHRVFGEAIAILAGDALLTFAFEVLGGMTELPPALVLSVIREVAQAAGPQGMIGGQVVDLESQGQAVSREMLEYMHRHKTGALIRAAVRAGARLAGANPEELACLTSYAEHFGLAFQIMDDVLDVIGEEERLGKPVGSDQRNQKATFVSEFGLEHSLQLAKEQARRAEDCLQGFGQRGWFLCELARYIIERQN